MNEATKKLPAPSLLRHLISMVYDALLVIALVFVVYAIALAAVVKISGGEQEVLDPQLGQALVVLSLLGFYSAFWLQNGQTLGMQAWRIKLVTMDGSEMKFSQAILRCAAAALSAGCLGLGYLWKLVDRNGRYWHDYLSGTELILLPKSSRDKS